MIDFNTLIILVLIGLSAGVLSGFIGVGGGIIIVPALIYILGLSPLQAQGTSLALMLPPIGVLAFMQYYKDGNFNLVFASIIAVTFVVGGFFGGRFAQKVDENLIKLIFGVLMIVVAIKMIVNGWDYFIDKPN